MDYTRVDDGSATGWLEERLTEFDGTVAGVVPGGFGAYARILHPAYHGDVAVAWREVAAANGRAAYALMQWDHIVGARQVGEQPGVWDEAPYEGNVPEALLRQLAWVLREHTGTPGNCWFGLWEGWGDSVVGPGDTARFEIPNREMLLLAGPLDTVHRSSLGAGPWATDDPSVAVAVGPEPCQPAAPEQPLDRDPFWRSPNMWWPDDRAWCVATDIDFTYTYVGGSEACVDAVLAADGIEAYRAHPIDPVTDESDHLNPRPA
ncbi:hypothetical protein [Streptomyces iranensis]|uniref:hypothetical protein n=1 Tax=Streptomyces iranensis TaxID=576784 RepID=UPI0039B74A7D